MIQSNLRPDSSSCIGLPVRDEFVCDFLRGEIGGATGFGSGKDRQPKCIRMQNVSRSQGYPGWWSSM